MRRALRLVLLGLGLTGCVAQVGGDDTEDTVSSANNAVRIGGEDLEVPPIDEAPPQGTPFDEVCLGQLCTLVTVDFQGRRPALEYQFRERDRHTILAAVESLGPLAAPGTRMMFLTDQEYAVQQQIAAPAEKKSAEEMEKEVDEITIDWVKAVSTCAVGALDCAVKDAPKKKAELILVVAQCTIALSECVSAQRIAQKLEAKKAEIEKAKAEAAKTPGGGGQPHQPVEGGGDGKTPTTVCYADYNCIPVTDEGRPTKQLCGYDVHCQVEYR